MGGAPFLNSSWEEEKFNVKDLFDKEPEIVVFLFLNHVVRRCRHPQNYSQEIVCLKSLIPLTLSEVLINDIVRMFKEIKIDTKLTQSVSQKLNAFFHKQVKKNLYKLHSYRVSSCFVSQLVVESI